METLRIVVDLQKRLEENYGLVLKSPALQNFFIMNNFS